MASTPTQLLGGRPLGSPASAPGSSGHAREQPAAAASDPPLEPYQQQPPDWRPSLHPKAPQHPVPDLFPTAPGQPEDDMSQISVRKGFVGRAYVRNESFSAHEMIHERLASKNLLPTLSEWFDEVLLRRAELHRNSIAPSQYKPPSRVTLNEAKLANYVKDLADPNVPLARLSRNVPHGFRGEKLFEMLWAGGALPAASATPFGPTASSSSAPTHGTAGLPASASTTGRTSVEVSRAVWFIRALGAAELSSLRNKSAASVIPETTSNLCSWMAKQLAELNLVQVPESSNTAAPSPATPSAAFPQPRTPSSASILHRRSFHITRTPSGLHPASSPVAASVPGEAATGAVREVCSTLQNEVDEARWIAKWSYSLSLARHLQAQQLLDRSVLVRWIVEAFATSNLVQLPFMLELVHEVLVLMLQRRHLVRPFLTALLHQIPALDARLDRRSSGELRSKLVRLVRVVCESDPDLLVAPRLWYDHAATLTQLLSETDTGDHGASSSVYLVTPEYLERHVRPRAERLLLKRLLSIEQHTKMGQGLSNAPAQVYPASALHADIVALDSFDMKEIDRVFLQALYSANQLPSRKTKAIFDDAAWTPRIETILTWACTDLRAGIARQYLAATLIEKIRFGVAWDEISEGSDNNSLRAFDLDHHSRKARRINVEPMLIKWLSDVESAIGLADAVATTTASAAMPDARTSRLASVDVACVVILVGELARRGIFSYTKYLQRLIARGMTTNTTPVSDAADPLDAVATDTRIEQTPKDSLHLRLLRSLPLYDQPASVYQQRRQAIYGDRSKETYEEAAERRALRQLKAFLPGVFAAEPEPSDQPRGPGHNTAAEEVVETADKARRLEDQLGRLWSASRYVRCKLFRNELLTAAFARAEALTGQDLCRIAAILERGQDFEAMAQLIAALLLRPLSDGLARSTFNLVLEFACIWRSMDIMGTLNQLVRQQLNHSSSVRNDKQAVMASTALLRLRTLMEGTSGRVTAPVSSELATQIVILQHVASIRSRVDALLHTISNADPRLANFEAAERLNNFRSLIIQPDAMTDEIVERAIVESVYESSDTITVSVAARLIEQLYLEASLEIDDRHARWLGHLAARIEQSSAVGQSAGAGSARPLYELLRRLVAQGTLNLQVAMDHLLLPCTFNMVKRMTDPASRSAEPVPRLLELVELLATLFAGVCGVEDDASWQDSRALTSQAMLLLAPANLPGLLKIAVCLICASDEGSPVDTAQRQSLDRFWKGLLGSESMQLAFRSDPRRVLLSLREASRGMWGINVHRVTDLAIGCLAPTSLLLKEAGSIDATAIKQRLDGWNTSMTAVELVEIFERLSVVESSFQARADSKTKSLAAGIFGDIFVTHPNIGPQFLRDSQSVGLASKFADVGLKSLAEATRRQAELLRAEREREAPDTKQAHETSTQATDSAEGSIAKATEENGSAGDAGTAPRRSPELTAVEDEIKTLFRSLLRLCEHQGSFTFTATDAESCARILHQIVLTLESGVGSIKDDAHAYRALAELFQEPLTLDLLCLILRFNCLWSANMKTISTRLVRALLKLAREAGKTVELGSLFVVLLDTIGFVIDELPLVLLTACIPEVEEQIQQPGELATFPRTARWTRFSFNLEGAYGDTGQFTASSAGAALKRGWFTPGGLNPWECPEYLDPAPVPAAATTGAMGSGTQGATAIGAARLASRAVAGSVTFGTNRSGVDGDPGFSTSGLPGAKAGWPFKLVLNSAIPASLLGMRLTRDLVPQYTSPSSPGVVSTPSTDTSHGQQTGHAAAAIPLPAFLESELSYGDRMAGESRFARDLRRGLLPNKRQRL
ncbi:hypothetical protein BCV70DRAFT_185819 [Testicularia cyperi]|uniref:Mediator of RNA polymerase II transcription subunit 12 n=1 Tax=Testicularia cyperi TaxID=1882483 RepID=A0A317XUM1_9BASI|nr:hypothetical protein BCV70DRAFT_185819 [Testicularia cyperi]